MNRRLASIGAILRKDVLSLAPLTAGAVILPLLRPWYHLLERYDLPSLPAYFFAAFVSALLAISVVQADAAASSRHDWLTRPIRRLDMVLAKAIYVVLTIVLPWIVGGYMEGILQMELPPGEAFAAAVGQLAILLGVPVVLAFACLTANLIEALVAMVATVLLFAGLATFFDKLHDTLPPRNFFRGDDVEWLAAPVLIAVALVGSIVILWLQYGRRRTLAARASVVGTMVSCGAAATIAATLGTPAVSGAAPADFGLAGEEACIMPRLAIPPRGEDLPDDAADLRHWSISERDAAGPHPQGLAVRTRVAGLPAGWTVITDRMEIAPIQGKKPFGGADWTNRSGQGSLTTTWLLSARQAATLARPDAQLRMDGRFTVMKPVRTWAFAADGKRHHLPGYGWCGSDPARPNIIQCREVWPFAYQTTMRPANQPQTCTVDCGVTTRTPAWLQIPISQTRGRSYSLGPDRQMVVTAYERTANVRRTLTFSGARNACTGPVIPAQPSNNDRLAAFAPHDVDKDGKLNRQEYGKLVEDLGTGGDIDDLFHRRDANLDGFVSPEEFRKPIA